MTDTVKSERLIGFAIEYENGRLAWAEWASFTTLSVSEVLGRLTHIREMTPGRSFRLVRVTAVREVIDV